MLYLASTSPRRRQLLEQVGWRFELVEPGPEPSGGGTAPARATARARAKAWNARVSGAAGQVLGADTVVWCEGQELGKPRDRRQAGAMLALLSGRQHEVHSAVCLVSHPGRRVRAGVAVARVRCRPLDAARIEAHLRSGDWRGKAGGYGIQDPGCDFVELVEGDLDTVVGLPLALVRGLLSEAEADGG